MPPDYPYSIHLVNPDSTYNFSSFEEAINFIDTTQLMSIETKNMMFHRLETEAKNYLTKPKEEYGDETFINSVFLFFVMMALGLSYFISKRIKSVRFSSEEISLNESQQDTAGYFIYNGSDLKIDTVTIENICLKYNAFYGTLSKPEQKLFLEKLKDFMCRKQFRMYGEDCYREMPVLLSATATQLGFGFLTFHLNNYPNIVIRPQAYIAYEPLRVLTGNVQGNTITVSWEHFLKDNLDPDDGNNVGLHEMAHAFAMQLLYKPSDLYEQSAALLRNFYIKMAEFIYLEKQQTFSLFDTYSLQNADECWAKCIELFFEKPAEMKRYYPELHTNVRMILNQ